MMNATKKTIIAIAVVAGIGGSVAAIPSFAEGPGSAPGASDGHKMGGGWMGRDHFRIAAADRVEARLAYAKVLLKITDAQTKQWNAVADFMRKQAKDREARMQAMMQAHQNGAKPDPLEMLQRRQEMLTKAAAGQAEFIAVVKPLYASLSDDQKKVAGVLLHPHGGGFRHHGGFGGRGGHGGPDGHGGPAGGPPPK